MSTTEPQGWALTDEHRALQDMVRTVVARAADQDRVREWDEGSEYPEEVWEALAESGLLGLPFPEDLGGSDAGLLEVALVIEQLSRHSVAAAFTYLISVCFGGLSLLHSGTDEQRQRILPALAAGKVRLSGAFTEPGGGSDLFALRSRAKNTEAGWVINGEKTFITAAQVADHLILLARTEPEGDRRGSGLTVFLVPTDSPGLQVQPLHPLGLRATGTNSVFLDDVLVPHENVVGKEGDGWSVLVPMLNGERILAGAWALGNGYAALDESVRYATTRTSFGKPIGSHQILQHYMADASISLGSARALLYQAATAQQAGAKEAAELSMMAKVACTEAGFSAAHAGMRVAGGSGYMMESPMQRFFRDAHVALLGPSTNEISKNFIARSLGLPRV